jgi:tRNA 2-selenouridine synthase
MDNKLEAPVFLARRALMPLIDVRSPAEHAQGHIPGALNLPLFDDGERKTVGTLYKTINREAAVMMGLELCGPKLAGFVKQASRWAPGKKVLMYCWRGGMRSDSMAWLLRLAGFEVYLLSGGYKAYRRYISDKWENKAHIIMLSGKTGTGKSEILRILKQRGQQVIDLERHANHKGSAFGAMGQLPQPTNEQFENLLAEDWLTFDLNQVVWIEDESRCIGRVNIPDKLFRLMNTGLTICMDMSTAHRLERLLEAYAHFPKSMLTEGIQKIQRKLGGQHARSAIDAIQQEDFSAAIKMALQYYDKAYAFDLAKKDQARVLALSTITPDESQNANMLLSFCRQHQLI